jgi:ABC-2 type transport system permease protein
MENSLNLSRWRETPRGVGYRRWVITSTGLRHLFRFKLFVVLVIAAWMAGLAIAILSFSVTQSVGSGGWLEDAAVRFGPRFEAVVATLGGFLALYPDVCIGGLFTLLFWLHSFVGLGLSLVALTLLVPRLIARDQASNALTIYLSRPLTSTDYLVGKLGTIAGVLLLMWTGPLVAGWGLSMMLAPEFDFFAYSFSPFMNGLLFNAIALVVLAAIALAVSALNRSVPPTIILWVGLWLIAGTVAALPLAPVWLQRVSFSHNLAEMRQSVFRLDSALTRAAESLPLLSENIEQNLRTSSRRVRPTDTTGAVIGLGVLTILSSAVFLRKLRPE